MYVYVRTYHNIEGISQGVKFSWMLNNDLLFMVKNHGSCEKDIKTNGTYVTFESTYFVVPFPTKKTRNFFTP